MGSLFRCQEMALCQLFLRNEAAYNSVSILGERGLVQFRDTNASVSAFQKKFITQIRRCDEMDRKLRFIEKEIRKDEIRMEDVEGNPLAPQPKEIIDLEATFEKLETDLKEVNSNTSALKKTFFELTELKNILIKAEDFFIDQEHAHSSVESLDHTTLVQHEVSATAMQLGFVAGVIHRERVLSFERMLWRVCRGNVFLKQSDMGTAVEDPDTGEKLSKVVFILFFQGEQLKTRVKKICEGFRATLYPCPETHEERQKMLSEIKTRMEDIHQVLSQTQEHHHRLLTNAAKDILTWMIKVRKVKAIYHTMNMFNQDVTKECLIAEFWCAHDNLSEVQQVLLTAAEESGSYGPSIVNRLVTKENPPSYNVLNKFTSGFQAIVDAYGVATYREVNPALYTIVTFPFLFAVMFGDCGHGLLMSIFALWMVLKEKVFLAKKVDNEMWSMMFGGRYIVLMMGLFSIYTGLIYNDAYSKSLNIFGTSWKIPQDLILNGTMAKAMITLNPTVAFNNSVAYPFGIDPIWQMAGNKILFLNSYKMKLSIIFGVSQMSFGVFLSLLNHVHFRRPLNILCDFIPQVIFLMSIFGYLVVLIFKKWISYQANGSNCAPSLLITLINMFLMKYPAPVYYNNKEVLSTDWEAINHLNLTIPCNTLPIYAGQKTLQTALVAIAFLCIPWMLLIKPFVKHYSKNKYLVSPAPAGEEVSFGDMFIEQAIHTIEYCLGSISHTASYLRLWALSLAHAELSDVLWTMVLRIGLATTNYSGLIMIYLLFAAWAVLTIGILLIMEGLSAFLHALRLHWVEFQSKFYDGQGYHFVPFSFAAIMENESGDLP